MKYATWILAGGILLSMMGGYSLLAEKDEPQKSDMDKKLIYSTSILEGLVEEDFDKILKSARLLNKLGERKWLEKESPSYRMQNQVFWHTAEALKQAAEDKNIDGATLAYTQMTISCVNCHKALRKE